MKELTQERLKELLDYNPETGIFVWKINRRGSARAGDIAGTKSTFGYLQIKIDGKSYRAHRLAWLFIYGHFPKGQLDHRNRVRDANWIENLREVSQSDNSKNVKVSIRNTSGIKGVYYSKIDKRWYAGVRVMNKQIHLGYFKNKIGAARARVKAEKEYGWVEYDTYESSAHRYIRIYEDISLKRSFIREMLREKNI